MVSRREEAVAALGWAPEPGEPVWLLSPVATREDPPLPAVVLRAGGAPTRVEILHLYCNTDGTPGESRGVTRADSLRPRWTLTPTEGAHESFVLGWRPAIGEAVLWWYEPAQRWEYGRFHAWWNANAVWWNSTHLPWGHVDCVQVGLWRIRGARRYALEERGAVGETVQVRRHDLRPAW